MEIFKPTRRQVLFGSATLFASTAFAQPALRQSGSTLSFEGPQSPYLAALRRDYGFDAVVKGAHSDFERVRRLTHWVHGQWKHGQNMASAPDARTILHEASTKGDFRCTEFAQVLAAACSSIGIPARPVSLLTQDAAESGAAHVAVEAYDRKKRRWFHADSQFDVLAMGAGKPVNLMELQRALDARQARLASLSGVTLDHYAEFVRPYLFYLDTPLDCAFSPERKRAGKYVELVYVPSGAPDLTHVGSWKLPARYVRSVSEFYLPPAFT